MNAFCQQKNALQSLNRPVVQYLWDTELHGIIWHHIFYKHRGPILSTKLEAPLFNKSDGSYDTGEKDFLFCVQEYFSDHDELHNSQRFALCMHFIVVLPELSVEETSQNRKISTRHQYSGAVSQKHFMPACIVALWYSVRVDYSLYEHILQNFKVFNIQYHITLCFAEVEALCFTRNVKAPFLQRR